LHKASVPLEKKEEVAVDDSATDRLQIQEIAARYAFALDDRNWPALRELFTDDAVMDFAIKGEIRGADAIVKSISTDLALLDASHHLIGAALTSVEGDVGRCRCYFWAQHLKADFEDGDQLIIAGEYQDQLARSGQGWRIARRTQTVLWRAGNLAVAPSAQHAAMRAAEGSSS
jgi:ketosteroid isomerase-like protein